VIAISDLQKRELTEGHRVCDPSKVHVIPLGLDLEPFRTDTAMKRQRFRQRFQLADDEIAIGIIGRIVPIKNHELFVRALANVIPRSSRKVRGFIIGDGENRHQIEHLARSLHLGVANGTPGTQPQALTFTSWIREIDEVTAGVDIVALTSLNEGTPVSLIEAQAANKPIVSTRVGGIEDVVIEGETALLSEVGDLDGFTENLLKTIDTHGLNGHVRDGFDFVKTRFSYHRLVEDTRALYHRLLAAKGWGRA
jgi:glycosyltransferase involved in cell wall biosynthesis